MSKESSLLKSCLLQGVMYGGIAAVVVSYLSLKINYLPFSLINVTLYFIYHFFLYGLFGFLSGWILFFLISLFKKLTPHRSLQIRPILIPTLFILLLGLFIFNVVKKHPAQIRRNKIQFDFASRQSSNTIPENHNSTGFDRKRSRTVVFALDAAEFAMIDTLRTLEKLPTFDRLIRNGVRGNLKTFKPTRSPVLWTTMATSRPPQEHGIWDFVLGRLPGTSYTRGRFKYPSGSGLENFGPLLADLSIVPNIPYTSNLRRTKAFWEILSDYDNTVGVTGWYTTFPAEPVNGFLISDGVFFSADFENQKLAELFTYPPELYSTIKDSIKNYRDMTEEQMIAVFNLTETTWDAMKRSKYSDNMKYLLRETYTKDLNSFRIAKTVLSEETYNNLDVSVIYFKALDEISHATCEENIDAALTSDENYDICWDTITATYSYIDGWMADILDLMPEDVTVLLISDHGFSYGDIFGGGKSGHWEAQDGVFVISGPNVKKGGQTDDVTILDFLPTLLYLQDIPIAVDLRGRVLAETFESEFLTRNPVQQIATYEYGTRSTDNPVESDINKEIEKKLKSLGYIK